MLQILSYHVNREEKSLNDNRHLLVFSDIVLTEKFA